MKNIQIHLRSHALFYFLALAILAVVYNSYARFMVNHDYFVEYEGMCDPVFEHCFVGFEDGDAYYYTKIIKYAPDLYKQCGSDITDCEASNLCLPNDRGCSVTYCDITLDGNICSKPHEEDSNLDLMYNSNI